MTEVRSRCISLAFVGLTGCTVFVDWDAFHQGADGGAAPLTDAAASDASDASVIDTAAPEGGAGEGGSPARGLVLEWSFDDGSGTVVADGSGHGHTGTATGGTWSADRKGVAGKAYTFTSPNSIVVAPASSDFDRSATGELTLMAWVRFDTEPNHSVFVSVEYGAKESAFGLEMHTATSLNYWDGVGHIAQADGLPNVMGAWHHTAVVARAANIRLYLDGTVIGQGVADVTPRTATRFVAGRSNYDNRIGGALDDVRFFQAALSDAEIVSEMNR
jgi:hypothetical protein